MLFHNWPMDSFQPCSQEDQLSGSAGGCGASQQETPRMEDGDGEDESGCVFVSLATSNMAFWTPQRQRAAREA